MSKGPPTILHVYCGMYPAPRGTQVLIKQCLELTAQAGFKTILFARQNKTNLPIVEKNIEFKFFKQPEVIKTNNDNPSVKKILTNLLMIKALKKTIKAVKPALVHAHHYEALVICKAAIWPHKIPLVFHQHALFEPELPLYAPAFLKTAAKKTGVFIDSKFPHLADHTIAVTPYNENQLKKHKVCSSKITLLYPGIKKSYKKNYNASIENKPITGLYSGNLDKYQGMEVLQKALDILCLPAEKFILKIITSDSLKNHPLIKHKNIKIVKFKNFTQELKHLKTADFAIIPRNHPGGIPIKMINAIKAQLPILADKNVAQMLTTSEALLIDATSAVSMAKGLNKMISNPSLRQKLSSKSHQVIWRLFLWNDKKETLYNTYQSLM